MGVTYPWAVFIDNEKFYWIEEYPWNKRTQALNGFIFGIYGLYDYYHITDDLSALHLCQASITTVENYIDQYRVPDGISYYCLRQREQLPKYHLIHTNQLRMLYKITNHGFFSKMADAFYTDYH
jgi:hypothetical protein